MDTSTLVSEKINEGRNLARQLIADQVDVKGAAWVKSSLVGDWLFYILTKLVDEKGLREAYEAIRAALKRLPDPWIGMSEIKPIGFENPIARDILAAGAQSSGNRPVPFLGQQLGGVPIDGAYIYPLSALSAPTFNVIARGKDEVLRYLEDQARSRTGTTGEYLLGRNEEGHLVAFLAGHGFLGAGTISLGGENLTVIDGIVVGIHARNHETVSASVLPALQPHGTTETPC
jgi:hypothetical protein